MAVFVFEFISSPKRKKDRFLITVKSHIANTRLGDDGLNDRCLRFLFNIASAITCATHIT